MRETNIEDQAIRCFRSRAFEKSPRCALNHVAQMAAVHSAGRAWRIGFKAPPEFEKIDA